MREKVIQYLYKDTEIYGPPIMRKHSLRVCEQLALNPICSATETSYDYYDLNVANVSIIVNKNFERKIVNIFLPIRLTYVLGAQKNRLIETVLLSTHNICLD